MFGYVRPVVPELKCKDFDLYKATYCGLCRTLRKRYGIFAPLFLNYDFTFLALLLHEAEPRLAFSMGRCHANPFRKCEMCIESDSLNAAADESIILTYWKLRDSISDDTGWRGLSSRFFALILKPAYQKAARRSPNFDALTQTCLSDLARMERDNCPSLDRPADAFARILQGAALEEPAPARRRVLEELFYHLGRWIYLLDAWDDVQADLSAGNYNPIAARFGDAGGEENLTATLNHSLNLMRSAFQLGEFGCRSALIENILYLGLPLIQRAVFDGSWGELKKQRIWSNKR